MGAVSNIEQARSMVFSYLLYDDASRHDLPCPRHEIKMSQCAWCTKRHKDLCAAMSAFAHADRATTRFVDVIEVLQVAFEVGQHWRDQEGINVAMLDKLAKVTE